MPVRVASVLPQNPFRFEPATYTLRDVSDADAFQRFSAYKTRAAAIASIERLTAFDRREELGIQGIGSLSSTHTALNPSGSTAMTDRPTR